MVVVGRIIRDFTWPLSVPEQYAPSAPPLERTARADRDRPAPPRAHFGARPHFAANVRMMAQILPKATRRPRLIAWRRDCGRPAASSPTPPNARLHRVACTPTQPSRPPTRWVPPSTPGILGSSPISAAPPTPGRAPLPSPGRPPHGGWRASLRGLAPPSRADGSGPARTSSATRFTVTEGAVPAEPMAASATSSRPLHPPGRPGHSGDALRFDIELTRRGTRALTTPGATVVQGQCRPSVPQDLQHPGGDGRAWIGCRWKTFTSTTARPAQATSTSGWARAPPP